MKTQSLSNRAYSVWNGTKTYTHKQSKHPTLIKLKIIIKGYVNPYENLSIARTWKQPRCPSANEWIRKLWYIYTMEYYSAIKKNSFESVLMR